MHDCRVRLGLTLFELLTGLRLRSWIILFALLIGSTCLVLGASIAGWVWSGAEPSELPSWLQAFATFAVFVAAVVAVFFAARAFQIETHRDMQLRWRHITAQSSRVAGWYGNEGTSGATDGVWLRNTSELPVTEVRASLLVAGHKVGSVYRPVLPPGEAAVFIGQDHETNGNVRDARRKVGVPDFRVDVELSFVDSSGYAWRRTREGKLVEPEERRMVIVLPKASRWDIRH